MLKYRYMTSLKPKKLVGKKSPNKASAVKAKTGRTSQVDVDQKDLDKIITKVLSVDAWQKKKAGLLSGRTQPNKKRRALKLKRRNKVGDDWE